MNTTVRKTAVNKKSLRGKKKVFKISEVGSATARNFSPAQIPINAPAKINIAEHVEKKREYPKVVADTKNPKNGYLTKRILVNKAQAAGRVAAQKAMQTMGFVITAQDGWIVKKYQDGQIEKISVIQ